MAECFLTTVRHVNAVNKGDYLARLQTAVQQLHNCAAVWRKTVPVHEVFKGQTVWKGKVEVFELTGHPKAKWAYAWSHRDMPNDEAERFVAVLELSPVESPVTAVRASIMADAKNPRGPRTYLIPIPTNKTGKF